MNNSNYVVRAGIIASLYIVLTLMSNMFNLAYGPIQVRFAEALTVLPYFTMSAIPGLFIGCLISNILIGALIPDIIFGSIATLIGAVGTYLLRKHKVLMFAPPVLSNTIIVPFVLAYAYKIKDAIWYMMLTVGLGEFISCVFLGVMLLKVLNKSKIFK